MITIKVAQGRLELQAPYHPMLPFRSRQIGGKWLGSEIGWVFPLEEEQALRRVCLDIWAVDGSPSSSEESAELRITVDERAPVRAVFVAYQSPIYLVGREIAASLQNRRAARPGRGIKFLTGKPRCVSSPSTWMTVIPNGSVFMIRDVPVGAINRFKEAIGDAGHVEALIVVSKQGQRQDQRHSGPEGPDDSRRVRPLA